MSRRLSLLTPSGRLTLGNLLGALRPMRAAQDDAECFYGLSDLHALTTPRSPDALRTAIAEQSTLLLAVGLDRATLFRQSQVPTHTALSYLLECVATTGELSRMIQFKEKSRRQESVRVSLSTYPVLMAADILLYGAEQVPVGDDQRQHIELARDLAVRFNTTYGEVFTVPEITVPPAGARVMDLADPTSKMSKSGAEAGSIALLDPPDVVAARSRAPSPTPTPAPTRSAPTGRPSPASPTCWRSWSRAVARPTASPATAPSSRRSPTPSSPSSSRSRSGTPTSAPTRRTWARSTAAAPSAAAR
jgi:tryptophanyl-tRNA synthetase